MILHPLNPAPPTAFSKLLLFATLGRASMSVREGRLSNSAAVPIGGGRSVVSFAYSGFFKGR
jgi:hypothetical protein